MAAGLPVVAVSGSGVNDVVVNGENGFKTELNEELWIKPIEEIMENSYLFKSLKIGAYNTAKEYTAESIAKLTEENYLQLIQGKVKYVVP
jgi:glycosyltransferase involved in cell wall biosynthesis